MKRIILIIFLVFIITGCTAEYNLKISDNSIEENFNSLIYLSEIPKPNPLYPDIPVDDQLTPFIEGEQYPFFNNYKIKYNKKVTEEDEYRLVNYKYQFTPKEFAESRVLKLCFENVKYKYKDNYAFNLTGKFYCLYNNELYINVITNNKVLSHNADTVKKNKYTWHITRKNIKNVNISMEIERHGTIKKISNYTIPIVIIFIITLFLSTFIIIKKKNKKHNQI